MINLPAPAERLGNSHIVLKTSLLLVTDRTSLVLVVGVSLKVNVAIDRLDRSMLIAHFSDSGVPDKLLLLAASA